MIGFSCTNCGHAFSVQDEYLGQRIKCPRCDFVSEVVDDSGRIQIICQNCGNENNVPENLAGRELKCPKCNNTVIAATIEKESADEAEEKPKEKKPEKPEKSEISEHGLIIIISATAAVIVIGLIIIAAVIPSYKARRARQSQEPQNQQQADDARQTEQNVQSTRIDTSRRRYPIDRRRVAKRNKIAAIIFGIAISCSVLLFLWTHWCPNCRKMWAMKRITPFFNFGDTTDYECKYCRYMKSHSRRGL